MSDSIIKEAYENRESLGRIAPLQLDIQVPESLKGCRHFITTWEEHMKIYKSYGSGQTPERIAERGGFGIKEAHTYYGWEHPYVEALSEGRGWIPFVLTFNGDTVYWEEVKR